MLQIPEFCNRNPIDRRACNDSVVGIQFITTFRFLFSAFWTRVASQPLFDERPKHGKRWYRMVKPANANASMRPNSDYAETVGAMEISRIGGKPGRLHDVFAVVVRFLTLRAISNRFYPVCVLIRAINVYHYFLPWAATGFLRLGHFIFRFLLALKLVHPRGSRRVDGEIIAMGAKV